MPSTWCSSERRTNLREFRAGTMAHLVGPVPAVVIGGLGTLAVAILWSIGFPQLRRIDSLDAPNSQDRK